MFSPGETLDGRYRVLRELGAGGMGTVYEGENIRIKRRVAIKVLHASAAGNAELTARFEREAQAAGQIGSDHITEVLDLGELPGGHHYIVMEYLEGEPLSARMQRHQKLPPEQLLPLVRQILVGLDAAHAAGIVHRDIKPDNVFVVPEKVGVRDFIKLLDFGVSKFRESQDSMSLTRTGAVVGTPNYLSPEQARGSGEATLLSDLYSVGVILYEGLTGQLPFQAQQFNDLLFQIVLAPLIQPIERAPEIPPGLNSIVCKAMARDPQYRFQSALEFVQALDQFWADGSGVEMPPLDPPPELATVDAPPPTRHQTDPGDSRPSANATSASATNSSTPGTSQHARPSSIPAPQAASFSSIPPAGTAASSFPPPASPTGALQSPSRAPRSSVPTATLRQDATAAAYAHGSTTPSPVSAPPHDDKGHSLPGALAIGAALVVLTGAAAVWYATRAPSGDEAIAAAASAADVEAASEALPSHEPQLAPSVTPVPEQDDRPVEPAEAASGDSVRESQDQAPKVRQVTKSPTVPKTLSPGTTVKASKPVQPRATSKPQDADKNSRPDWGY